MSRHGVDNIDNIRERIKNYWSAGMTRGEYPRATHSKKGYFFQKSGEICSEISEIFAADNAEERQAPNTRQTRHQR